jgi:hypothetical protein
MKEAGVEYKKEFDELVGDIAQSTRNMQDPVAIGVMLYTIAEEKKNTNLVIRELNAKIDSLMNKLEKLEQKSPAQTAAPQAPNHSDRDLEVLQFVRKNGRSSAEDLQRVFDYKGKNAASARLSKLFHEGSLDKEYAGRKVYYKIR